MRLTPPMMGPRRSTGCEPLEIKQRSGFAPHSTRNNERSMIYSASDEQPLRRTSAVSKTGSRSPGRNKRIPMRKSWILAIVVRMKEGDMKRKAASIAVRLILGLVPAVCVAQDFSADVVYFPAGKADKASERTETPVHSPSRLYVSEDNIRLETRGLSGTVLVVDGAEQAAYALFPAKKEYEPLAGGLPEYFRARDVENACADWQRAAGQKIDCEKVGHEVVDGRQAVKYRNKGAPTLPFPLFGSTCV